MNNKKGIILLLLLLLPSFAWALVKGHGVEVRLATPKLVESEPGKIITASFFVSNNTEGEEEFFEELQLPPAWQVIIPPIPFKLKAREEQARIVAFLVPANFPAESCQIAYAVKSQRDYGITDMDTLTVVVLPVVKLEILIEDRPEYVIAGDSYKARLRLVNRGNSNITIRLSIKGTPDYPLKGVPSGVTLEAGQSHSFTLEVKTDEKLNQRISHILKIKAEADGPTNSVVSAEQTISVKVIPRMTGKFDPYHRLHSQISFIGAKKDEKGGFQVEFSGSGSLDEEGKRRVDFLFRGPDIQDKSIFGQRDECRLNYYGRLLDLHLGDSSYFLSPLTEQYRYGRGVGVDIHPPKIGVGAFYLERRWEEPEEKEGGTYLKYQFNEMFSIKGNFLHKRKEANSSYELSDRIYSIEAQIKPAKEIDLGLEYGLSDSDRERKFSDNAYRVNLKGELSCQVRYTLEKTHAGPKYFSYYNDADYTFGTVTFPIYHNSRGYFSYRTSKDNLDLDSARGNAANREQSYRTGISYPFSFGANVYLVYEDFHREDRLLPADFDFRGKAWQLGLGQTFHRFGLQTYIERWKLEDRILNTQDDNLERYSIYANFYPTYGQTYTIYTRIGNDRYTGSPERTKSAGISAAWRIGNNFDASINYQKNNFDSDRRQEQETLLSRLTYTLPNSHSLALRGSWIRYKDSEEEEYSFILVYTIPLGIPVSKKKSIGIIKGMIRDGERPGGPPVPGVILTANGASAVTNGGGEFIFPSLKPGTYPLWVEKGSIGFNRVTTEELPMMVEVKGGETTPMDISVVTSCKISGRVVVFDFDNSNNLNDLNSNHKDNKLKEIVGLGGILVEITNGKELLRQLTDENGRFCFEDIRPSKWTLKIYSENLPLHHYLEAEEFQFELEPGEEKEIMVRVLPRHRPIQIIEEGEIR